MAEADRRRTGTTGTDRADRTRRGPGQGATVLAALLAAGACAGPAAATDIRLPALSEPCWSTESGLHRSLLLTAPDWTAETVPVLTFSARVESASPTGAVYALRLLINDLPVNQGFAHPRLLNKPAHFPANGPGSGAPWFKRTGLGYGIRENQAWLVPCAASFDDPATAYAIDLEGLVQPNRTFKLTLSAYTPNRKGTRRRDTLGEAALVLTPPKLALRPRPEVDALRAALMPPPVLTLAAAPLMTAPGAADANRPRELANPDRPPDPPATVTFEQLEGWRLESLDATNVTFASSAERVLRRAATAAVTFPAGAEMRLLLKPPAPIELPAPFDTLHLWYGGAIKERYFADAADIAGTVLLEDARGHRQAVDLGILRTEYYGLALGRLSAAQRAALEPPLRLRGIGLEVINSPVRQPLYLESLACFTDTHAPLADPYLPEEPVLPHRPEGLTPDPPADTRYAATLADGIGTLQSVGGGRRLAIRIEPARGMLHGITARRGDTPPFAPFHGGGIALDHSTNLNETVPPGAADVLGFETLPAPDTNACPALRARFRYRAQGRSADYAATYRLLGSWLLVDVTCPGGASAGLRFGRVQGLRDPRFVRMPYLNGMNIAMSDETFVFAGADWHHSDYSETAIQSVGAANGNGIGIAGATWYHRLTDGTRRDLRDRVVLGVSDRLDDVLPALATPPSPRRAALAAQTFRMGGPYPDFAVTARRYGIDHMILCNMYTTFLPRLGEIFTGCWEPHPGLKLATVRRYLDTVRGLGYGFGEAMDLRDLAALSPLWTPARAAYHPDGRLVEGWTGCLETKPSAIPGLARLVGGKLRERYAPDCIYMDTHTNMRNQNCDYEAGASGAGIARAALYANGKAMREVARLCGSVISEGQGGWFSAGCQDMDYAQVVGLGPDPDLYKPLVDFELKRLHSHRIGTMMGFTPASFLKGGRAGALYSDPGGCAAPPAFHQLVSASLLYGHMAMTGYGWTPPPARLLQLYALMQAPQSVYLPDDVAEIRYHDGEHWMDASEALRASRRLSNDWDVYNRFGRVRVRYQGGMTVWVNYGEAEPWSVEHEGTTYTLPNYGWLITLSPPDPNRNPNPASHNKQDDEDPQSSLLAYSALADGRRVDYVRSRDYLYVHTGGKPATLDIGTVDGAVWIKTQPGNARQVIPCGDLGRWAGPPNRGQWHQNPWGARWVSDEPGGILRRDRLVQPPSPDRGCPVLALDTRVLMDCEPAAVRVTARGFTPDDTRPVAARIEDGLLALTVAEGMIDFLLEPAAQP